MIARQPLSPTCQQWDAEIKWFAQGNTAGDPPDENGYKLQGKRSFSDHCDTHPLIWRYSRTIHMLNILVNEQTPLSCSFQLPGGLSPPLPNPGVFQTVPLKQSSLTCAHLPCTSCEGPCLQSWHRVPAYPLSQWDEWVYSVGTGFAVFRGVLLVASRKTHRKSALIKPLCPQASRQQAILSCPGLGLFFFRS